MCPDVFLIQDFLSFLQLLVDFEGLFGDCAVLSEKLVVGQDLVELVLPKESTVGADETTVL